MASSGSTLLSFHAAVYLSHSGRSCCSRFKLANPPSLMDKSLGPCSKPSFVAANHLSACMASLAAKDDLRCSPRGVEMCSRSIMNGAVTGKQIHDPEQKQQL